MSHPEVLQPSLILIVAVMRRLRVLLVIILLFITVFMALVYFVVFEAELVAFAADLAPTKLSSTIEHVLLLGAQKEVVFLLIAFSLH